MKIDAGGWLVPEAGGVDVVRLPTVRTVPLQTPQPRALVWHATGGVGGVQFAENLARRIQTYHRGTDRPASWHLLIPRSSPERLYQSAPLNVGTWHVGKPGTIDHVAYPHINSVTIGVELENAGPLVEVRGAHYAYPYWADASNRVPDPRCRVPAGRVRLYEERAFDTFTAEQVTVTRELVRALSEHFRWSASEFQHCHAEFAAPAKTDPGPLWMRHFLPEVLSDVFVGDGPTIVTDAPETAPASIAAAGGAS